MLNRNLNLNSINSTKSSTTSNTTTQCQKDSKKDKFLKLIDLLVQSKLVSIGIEMDQLDKMTKFFILNKDLTSSIKKIWFNSDKEFSLILNN